MTIDLQEKRILLYIDRVHGVKFVIVQNITSEMTEQAVEGKSSSYAFSPHVLCKILADNTHLPLEGRRRGRLV